MVSILSLCLWCPGALGWIFKANRKAASVLGGCRRHAQKCASFGSAVCVTLEPAKYQDVVMSREVILVQLLLLPGFLATQTYLNLMEPVPGILTGRYFVRVKKACFVFEMIWISTIFSLLSYIKERRQVKHSFRIWQVSNSHMHPMKWYSPTKAHAQIRLLDYKVPQDSLLLSHVKDTVVPKKNSVYIYMLLAFCRLAH